MDNSNIARDICDAMADLSSEINRLSRKVTKQSELEVLSKIFSNISNGKSDLYALAKQWEKEEENE